VLVAADRDLTAERLMPTRPVKHLSVDVQPPRRLTGGLERSTFARFHNVIVMCYPTTSTPRRRCRTLVTLLHLRDIAERTARTADRQRDARRPNRARPGHQGRLTSSSRPGHQPAAVPDL